MSRFLSVLFWSVLPAAFIGPGTVTSAASAGAEYGHRLLWALLFSTIATIVLQEMAARLTIASGLELGEAIARRHGTWLRALAGGAVILGCAAYEAGNFAGAIRGVQLLRDGPRAGILAFSAVLCTGLLWWSSTAFVARLLGVLVAIMGVCFLYAAVALRPPIADLLAGVLRPSLPEGSNALAIALIGTTVVPYNLFLGSSLARGRSLREARFGIAAAVGVGGLISAAILIVGAALHGSMDFVALSDLLRTRLGPLGSLTLGVGLAAAGLSSAITAPLAAAFAARAVFGDAQAANWARDGRNFRTVWLGVLGFGSAVGLSQLPILPVIVSAQIVNGLLLPLCALFLLLAMNAGGPLPREQRNGRLANFFGACVVCVTAGIGLRAILRALGFAGLTLLTTSMTLHSIA
jgi:Mn2+/Fe2+ NRAMP family transporter